MIAYRPLLLSALALLVAGCANRPQASLPSPAFVAPASVTSDALPAPSYATLPLPPAAFASLPNGIRVGAFPSQRAPYVYMQLQIDAGRMLHGAEADVLTEHLRLIGNADSPSSWQQHWRTLGTNLTAQSGNHRLLFTAEVLPHQADRLLDTLLMLWQQPNLSAPETLAQAQRLLRTSAREEQLQGGDAKRLWDQLAHGREHPYARSAPDASSLRNVSVETLRASWQRAQSDAQQWLFAGAFSADDLARWQQKLAALPAVAPTPRWRTAPPPLAPAAPEWTIHVLHTPGAAQVSARVGVVIPPGGDSTRWHCQAMATVLSTSSGRLFRDLRERRGFSYDPGATCSMAPFANALVLTANAKPEHAAALLHGLRDHLRLLREHGVREDEVQRLQTSLRGSMRMQLETARSRSHLFHIEEWLGGGWQQLSEQDQFWQQLSTQDLQKFALEWLQAEPVTVLSGDADDVLKQLRQLLPEARIIRHDNVD